MKFINLTFFMLTLTVGLISDSSGVTFTVNTYIGPTNTSYENQDIIISGCVVTIDGDHTFQSLQVLNGGTLTHTATTPDPMNLTISQNAYVDPLSFISADSKGYASGIGPGKGSTGTSYGGGAGYGGMGSAGYDGTSGGNVYGSIDAPTLFGSGGGLAGTTLGGTGGGIIRMTVAGTLTVDGLISSNGSQPSANYSGPGGGSGGSVYLSVGILEGMGTISANGGAKALGGNGGGGGGGRIAVYYDTKDYFYGNIIASGKTGYDQGGGAGTVYLKSDSEPLGHLTIDNDNLNGALTPLPDSFSCADVTIADYGKLDINSPEILSVTEGITVDYHGYLYLHSTLTLPYLHVLSGGEVGHSTSRTGFNLIVSGNADVEPGGSISADGKGYTSGLGPGKGSTGTSYGGGGGYGGTGGAGYDGTPGGSTYGSPSAPTLLGSGGGLAGTTLGGTGGGIIRMAVAGTLTVDGLISSNGSQPSANYSGPGGGSGGSVYLSVGILEGMGTISANGGAKALGGNGGGGGGGRIAIYTATNDFIGNVLVSGGLGGGTNGQSGTIHYGPSVFGCGDATHPHPVGDFEPDCRVDLFDFAIFAEHWLEDTN